MLPPTTVLRISLVMAGGSYGTGDIGGSSGIGGIGGGGLLFL